MAVREKHTAGPWAVAPMDSDATVICPDGRRFMVGDTIYHPENRANARLIAAAPDLLDALRALLSRYVGLVNCGDCGNWNPEMEPEVQTARAAISKAEG
jgi:hypothetical protein